jgi:tRNA threonylcarbamoyladenosine biosynthesis protein TsaB
VLVLGLNTAFAALDACVLGNGKRLSGQYEALARGHEMRLPGLIDAALSAAGVGLRDLDRLAVVTGPGSFTGIRVGVGYMRGLALVTQVPCLGLTALEAAVPHGLDGRAIACLPGRQRLPDVSWWVQTLEDGIGAGPVEELSVTALMTRLTGFHGSVFIDDVASLGALADDLDVHAFVATAETAARKAAGLDPALHPPAPVYARDPDAALPQIQS